MPQTANSSLKFIARKIRKRSRSRPDPDASALYRTADDAIDESTHEAKRLTLRLGPLQEARFRYCDGVRWSRTWDSNFQGGLPVAVELSFDLPAAGLRPPVETESETDEDPLGESRDQDDVQFATPDEPLLGLEDLYGDDDQVPTSEYRIVIFVRSADPAVMRDAGGRP